MFTYISIKYNYLLELDFLNQHNYGLSVMAEFSSSSSYEYVRIKTSEQDSNHVNH